MIVNRYNIVSGKYIQVAIPKEWNVAVKAENNDTIIDCIHCGQQIAFGESIESKRYKDQFDQSYRECITCYNNFLPITKLSSKEL